MEPDVYTGTIRSALENDTKAAKDGLVVYISHIGGQNLTRIGKGQFQTITTKQTWRTVIPSYFGQKLLKIVRNSAPCVTASLCLAILFGKGELL